MPPADPILTVAQMRSAEQALVAQGVSVDALMQQAGRGAAEWVWRIAGKHRVTVLCGPGNNGGDGYVIAQVLQERGGDVRVVAPDAPKSEACRTARALFQSTVMQGGTDVSGAVLVDCLFGNGLTRCLSDHHGRLLNALAASHEKRIAVDLPSGVEADGGAILGDSIPAFDLTLALGAWKRAHFLMPATARMGALRLVPIGIAASSCVTALAKPVITPPGPDAHKYRRGLLAVVGGAMPGAALLACTAAQGAGAGYVKLLSDQSADVPLDLVRDARPLDHALDDNRIGALLIGPGLGRDDTARARLQAAVASKAKLVIDADALMLLTPNAIAHRMPGTTIATPHEGELAALETAFGLGAVGSKIDRALALARRSGMVVVAKGPDTVIASPDGVATCAPRASAWLSTAGTGDVLAGTIASRLACGDDPAVAAQRGVWLHGEAARLCPPAFTAGRLAAAIAQAFARCVQAGQG
ncbi:NAD(P)H-hydrate epimerase [Novosphingobium sp. Leaf2]|uniref:NAD(P)H-hydrate epimerase n=1 Tax=Novosphingobium sp. Leaf2 TaxID=1735670 RepID=UPI0006F657BC|nr:NAD(P)H-hydrate epimerase [Novosphingobium sp. Leaf2]KQM17320.1 sugar kinase [Novosphingobium sp. Leaf2]